MDDRFQKNYTEKGFWSKVKKFSKKAGAHILYKALKLYYVMKKNTVPVREKAIIIAALGYFILPTDVIPDIIPMTGYTDDLGVFVAVLSTISKHVDDNVILKATKAVRKVFPGFKQKDYIEV